MSTIDVANVIRPTSKQIVLSASFVYRSTCPVTWCVNIGTCLPCCTYDVISTDALSLGSPRDCADPKECKQMRIAYMGEFGDVRDPKWGLPNVRV